MNIDPHMLSELKSLRGRLTIMASASECYNDGECEDRACPTCQARQALEELEHVIDPKHLPVKKYRDRLAWNNGVNAEARFLELWRGKNTRVPGVNGGAGVLENILGEEPSFRDAEVAATLIAWLGTNIGSCFLKSLLTTLEAVGEEAGKLRSEASKLEQAKRLFSNNPVPGQIIERGFLNEMTAKDYAEAEVDGVWRVRPEKDTENMWAIEVPFNQ